MKITRLILTLLAAATLGSCAHSQANPTPVADQDSAAEVDATSSAATADTLPLREAIARMLVVGFRGQEVDSLIAHDVRDLKVGGVILFDYDASTGQRHRNIGTPEQVSRLCHDLQQLSPHRLLIGIDQEGGNVSRLRTTYGFGPTRSARSSAAEGYDTVRHYARLCAEQLKELGINLNFAPCADVDVNPNCPVIGRMGRSFSADEEVVTRCSHIWIEEQRRAGVTSCMKHFPGHGSASGDTHKGLVDVSRSWQRRELEPYRNLIANGEVEMVMMAHVVCRPIDPTGLPASLSPAAYAYLRDSLGYHGLTITDDMGMGAITSQYGYAQALEMAINAGADLICLGNNSSHYDPQLAERTIDIIEGLVKEGRVKLRAGTPRNQ